jgi:Reverse transcriptase (RNA-dependent DNA polymerase)/RNase H-like domain found in reverse transcriptase/Integrase zinc binding domain/Integrase core domain
MLKDMEREPIEVSENANRCNKVKKVPVKNKIKRKIVKVTPVIIDNSRKMYEAQQEGLIDLLNGKGQAESVPVTEEEEVTPVPVPDLPDSLEPEHGSQASEGEEGADPEQIADPDPDVSPLDTSEIDSDGFNFEDLVNFKINKEPRTFFGIILIVVSVFYFLTSCLEMSWGNILLLLMSLWFSNSIYYTVYFIATNPPVRYFDWCPVFKEKVVKFFRKRKIKQTAEAAFRRRIKNFSDLKRLKRIEQMFDESVPVVRKLTLNEKLAKTDEYYSYRKGKLLNMATKKNTNESKCNYKVDVALENLSPVQAEIDTDSHISLIAEPYYLKHNKNAGWKNLDEPIPNYEGMGSFLTSKYKPISAEFQLGSVQLSGRFVISSELTSSSVLIGTDIFHKYKMGLHPTNNPKLYNLTVGVEPICRIPCQVVRKLTDKIVCNKIKVTEIDDSLEDEIEPGYEFGLFENDKEKELNFIRTHKNIPERLKPKLIEKLESVPNLFSGPEFSSEHFPAETYTHDIELLDGAPSELKCKPFPCSGIRLQQLKDVINDLISNKVLEPGDSDYISPCFFVTKRPSEGKTASKGRLCYDYRRLNSIIKPLHYPLYNLKTLFNEAAGYSIFSVIDIRNAFLSIPLSERAKRYSAIITPFGVFRPTRTPFGLKTSPSAFCSAMSKILGDLKFVLCYMDDLLICGNTEEEMAENLCIVFERLAKFKLKIQLSKTKLFERQLKILGMVFSKAGKQIDPEKIETINNFPEITSIKQCQSFLGMVNYLSSFIPHYSTALFPVFNLLKNQKNKKFKMTEEASVAIQGIKDFLKQKMMLSNLNLDKPLYLATDASQVGVGAFLYQLDVYPKNDKGREKCLRNYGFIPEDGAERYLVPGVSPGKNCPLVTDFMRDPENLEKYDNLNTLNNKFTMTEKIKNLKDKIIIVKPISFYSRLFTESQIRRYASMEKEFLALFLSIINFRDYLEACPVTFVLSDSQPILWALKHQNSCVKLSRHLLKLFEFNINLIITHIEGKKNNVADFFSRIYGIPEEIKGPKNSDLKPKDAQHVNSPFPPLAVVTKDQLINLFEDPGNQVVVPCQAPEFCHLNVNNYLYKGNIGPFEYKPTEKCAKITKRMEQFGVKPTELQEQLSIENLIRKQNKDKALQYIVGLIEKGKSLGQYNMDKGILFYDYKKQGNLIVVPKSLIPIVISYYHFQSHSGIAKLLGLIRTRFWWNNMQKDITEFARGCILCSVCKHTNQKQGEIGTPRMVPEPRHSWQIDVVSGLPSVRGSKSFLTCVDMFSGFCVPIPLRQETSETIALLLDSYIFKIFGPPKVISSDNAYNLAGPEIQKLFKFYNTKHLKTVPYSPQSHGLVEITNKNITRLLKIFTEQFSCSWLDVLTLSTMIANSVPRPVLEFKSPYFLMFGNDYKEEDLPVTDFIDVSDYAEKTVNNVNFAKLLREYLLQHRIYANKAKNRPYKSFPKESLIYVKDFSQTGNRKLKPVYRRIPLKIVKEYRATVYAIDYRGRISKHSKDNIKLAGSRSIQMFNALPSKIKLILGGPLDPDNWQELVNKDKIPDYLKDYELDFEPANITRSKIAKDTHLVETQDLDGNGLDDEDEDWSRLDPVISDLKELHSINGLNTPNFNWGNFEQKRKDLTEIRKEQNFNRISREVDPANIIADGSKRRVRFDIPKN